MIYNIKHDQYKAVFMACSKYNSDKSKMFWGSVIKSLITRKLVQTWVNILAGNHVDKTWAWLADPCSGSTYLEVPDLKLPQRMVTTHGRGMEVKSTTVKLKE